VSEFKATHVVHRPGSEPVLVQDIGLYEYQLAKGHSVGPCVSDSSILWYRDEHGNVDCIITKDNPFVSTLKRWDELAEALGSAPEDDDVPSWHDRGGPP
jgi:hypothetical protein